MRTPYLDALRRVLVIGRPLLNSLCHQKTRRKVRKTAVFELFAKNLKNFEKKTNLVLTLFFV
ncbi:MAG: hypothetical protein J5930_07530 [Treponema sp.]|nr:hypothetical protein [Treponema sp.]